MAIEDIIWAKNRHMFGGLEPNEAIPIMAGTISEEENSENNVRIVIEMPKDTIIDGQTVCTVGGVIIRGKLLNPPVDEFDGDLIGDYTESGTYEVLIPDVADDSIYYLSAFSYSDQGVFNKTPKIASVRGTAHAGKYLFGYDLDNDNPDPYDRVTYPEDVDNMYYTPAVLNDLRDWNITPGTKFMPRPCMLNYDGTVGEYLDPYNYARTIDGSISNVSNTSYRGNAMMEWPKIYTCRWEENGIYHFRCSDAPQEDGREWYCWCNYDINDNEVDHFYTGIYRSSISSITNAQDEHRSISGTNVNSDYYYLSTTVGFARVASSDWGEEYLADHLLIQDLLVMMGKSTDTQTVFGVGKGTFDTTNGNLNAVGLFYGGSDNTTLVKVFGMEDYWGVHFRCIRGLYVDTDGLYVKITKGTKDGSAMSANFSCLSHDVYFKCGTKPTISNDYILGMDVYPWGRLPKTGSGSSSTYECDFATLNVVSSGVTTIGGGVGLSSDFVDAYKGVYSYDCRYSQSNRTNLITTRLAYKPTAPTT